jgi:uncharacterized protein YkwD
MVFRGARYASVLALAAALVVLACPATTLASTNHSATALTSLESGVFQQLNVIRVQHGLVPLKLSASLTASSEQHSREMAVDGYFQHASQDGTSFWKRIGHWYPQTGFHYWSVGENLLWSSPAVDPAAAVQLWMNSPEHRANILTADWRQIGVAAVSVAAAPGVYKGLPVTIITTDFGFRR